eukprot:6194959-Pleurochrysis_carterae.AAC.1
MHAASSKSRASIDRLIPYDRAGITAHTHHSSVWLLFCVLRILGSHRSLRVQVVSKRNKLLEKESARHQAARENLTEQGMQTEEDARLVEAFSRADAVAAELEALRQSSEAAAAAARTQSAEAVAEMQVCRAGGEGGGHRRRRTWRWRRRWGRRRRRSEEGDDSLGCGLAGRGEQGCFPVCAYNRCERAASGGAQRRMWVVRCGGEVARCAFA